MQRSSSSSSHHPSKDCTIARGSQQQRHMIQPPHRHRWNHPSKLSVYRQIMLIHLHRHVSALSSSSCRSQVEWGGQPTRAAALWSHPLTHTVSAAFINRNQTCILRAHHHHNPSTHRHTHTLKCCSTSSLVVLHLSMISINLFFSTSTSFLHIRGKRRGNGLPFGHPLLIFGGWECHQGRKRDAVGSGGAEKIQLVLTL